MILAKWRSVAMAGGIGCLAACVGILAWLVANQQTIGVILETR